MRWSAFCFTPQDGNALISSVAAAAWFIYPEVVRDEAELSEGLDLRRGLGGRRAARRRHRPACVSDWLLALVVLQDDCSVRAAEAERIVQRVVHLHSPRLVGHVIEIALGVGVV